MRLVKKHYPSTGLLFFFCIFHFVVARCLQIFRPICACAILMLAEKLTQCNKLLLTEQNVLKLHLICIELFPCR